MAKRLFETHVHFTEENGITNKPNNKFNQIE